MKHTQTEGEERNKSEKPTLQGLSERRKKIIAFVFHAGISARFGSDLRQPVSMGINQWLWFDVYKNWIFGLIYV